jgi:hypothetical protein
MLITVAEPLGAAAASRSTVRTTLPSFVIATRDRDWTADANAQTLTAGYGQNFGTLQCFTLWAFNDIGRSFGGLDCVSNPNNGPR